MGIDSMLAAENLKSRPQPWGTLAGIPSSALCLMKIGIFNPTPSLNTSFIEIRIALRSFLISSEQGSFTFPQMFQRNFYIGKPCPMAYLTMLCTATWTGLDGGRCVAHGSMVHVYDWMMEQNPVINLDYQRVNDAIWVDAETVQRLREIRPRRWRNGVVQCIDRRIQV